MFEMMAAARHQRLGCDETIVQRERMETDPLACPKQEIEDAFVEEEPLFLHEWGLPDGIDGAQDPLSIKKEECSSSEEFLEPNSLNIKKTEDEGDEEEAASKDDGQELEDAVELTSSGREPESTIQICVEDNSSTDDRCDFVTTHKASYGNNSGTSYLVHRCAICKQIIARLEDLKEHTHVDGHELLNSCRVCHMTFTDSRSLKKHFYLHPGELPYTCAVCNSSSAEISSLRQHLMLHPGEYSYGCGICSKTFRRKCNLQSHLEAHSIERPYSCAICSRKFKAKTHLKSHSMVHTYERPYSCAICSRNFKAKTHLKSHSMVHTYERPYSCIVCSRTFKWKASMKLHSWVHNG